MFRSKNKRNNAVGHQNQAQATGSGRLVNFICLVLVLLAGMGQPHNILPISSNTIPSWDTASASSICRGAF